MNYADHAKALRDSADALEDAQRAMNHLEGLLNAWSEMTDAERWCSVRDAMRRLDGTWSGRETAEVLR